MEKKAVLNGISMSQHYGKWVDALQHKYWCRGNYEDRLSVAIQKHLAAILKVTFSKLLEIFTEILHHFVQKISAKHPQKEMLDYPQSLKKEFGKGTYR